MLIARTPPREGEGPAPFVLSATIELNLIQVEGIPPQRTVRVPWRGPSCHLKILASVPIEFIRARCSSMRFGAALLLHHPEDDAKTDIH